MNTIVPTRHHTILSIILYVDEILCNSYNSVIFIFVWYPLILHIFFIANWVIIPWILYLMSKLPNCSRSKYFWSFLEFMYFIYCKHWYIKSALLFNKDLSLWARVWGRSTGVLWRFFFFASSLFDIHVSMFISFILSQKFW